MESDLLLQGPGYVPSGFALRRVLDPAQEPGFGRDPNQRIYVYTHGWNEEDWMSPLMIVVGAPGGSPLIGTENRPGTVADLGVASVAAEYHDGVWTAAPDGSGRVVWNTAFAHSITARSPIMRVAVRGNKRQAPMSDLVAILTSYKFA